MPRAIRICIRDSIWRGIARIADAAVQERSPDNRYRTPYPTPGRTPYPTPGRTPHPTQGRTPHPTQGQTPYPTPGRTPHPTLAGELVAQTVDSQDVLRRL